MFEFLENFAEFSPISGVLSFCLYLFAPLLGEGLLCDPILLSPEYLVTPLLEYCKKFLSKDSVHVTVFSITRE
jgi:hypothetical protein